MTSTPARVFVCQDCSESFPAAARGPLPARCPGCKRPKPPAVVEGFPLPPGKGAGPFERQLLEEIATLPVSEHPHDGTLRMVALSVARLADQSTDLKTRMQALREYQRVLGQLSPTAPSSPPAPAPPTADLAVVETEPEGPFGAIEAEFTGEVDLGECVPRWATRRRLDRKTWGPYFGRVAAALGKGFMPWQQHAADIAGEVDHTGRLCYQQVVITVPRQSGKTTWVLSIAVGRAEAGRPFGGRQNMLYAAQTQLAAVKKFKKEYIPEIKSSPVMRGRFLARIANGSESITFTGNDSTFAPIATGETAGHGEVLDFGCLDETFAQKDDSVEGSWTPATITRPMAQIVMPSTAGDATAVYFRGKVKAGRLAAMADVGYGSAYIEYSADDDAPGFDPGDESMWRRVMPALGKTQPIEGLRAIFQKYQLEGKIDVWKRAFLNIWVDKSTPSVFDADAWAATQNPGAVRATRPVLAIDVSADRSHTSIVLGAAVADSTPMVRVIDYRPGSDWVVDRILQLREDHDVAMVIVDAAGPVKSLIPELENEYIRHHVTTAGEMVAACGLIFDAVRDGKIVTMGEPALELAVQNAERRNLLDAWAWTRKQSLDTTGTDISPLVAATLAHWGQIKYGDDPTQTGGSFG